MQRTGPGSAPPWKPEGLIDFLLGKKPLFAAGEDHYYADTNYLIAGMIIERITDQTLYREVTRRFLKPLNLAHTIPQEGRASLVVTQAGNTRAEPKIN